jgi:hypothetical protein
MTVLTVEGAAVSRHIETKYRVQALVVVKLPPAPGTEPQAKHPASVCEDPGLTKQCTELPVTGCNMIFFEKIAGTE